jgi:small subunit ribosomal protein S18
MSPAPKNQNQNQTQLQKQRRGDLRKKQCPFAAKGTKYIDWKDYPTLKEYTDYFGNIRNRYYTGVSLKYQKMLRLAIERARFMGMLSYRK